VLGARIITRKENRIIEFVQIEILSITIGVHEENKPLTFGSSDKLLEGRGMYVVELLKTLIASDPSMMSIEMQTDTARACWRIVRGRGAYDTSQDASDPPPGVFMKRMVNHRVPGLRGEQRMGIMEYWTHAGVPLRKAACDGSSKKCGIRYIVPLYRLASTRIFVALIAQLSC
jgi:hypothetical protein